MTRERARGEVYPAGQEYHAITLGFYENELIRRVDPKHRSIGQFFQDEIASPLGLDVYIRLPERSPTRASRRSRGPASATPT